MAKGKPLYRVIFISAAIVFYSFFVARPVREEIVITPDWIRSPESAEPQAEGTGEGELIPFKLGSRFGYFSEDGNFAMNRLRRGYVLLTPSLWAEFEGAPSSIAIKNPASETVLTLENPPGYPFFSENKIFIMYDEQNSMAFLDADGKKSGRYDFGSTVTALDVKNGRILAGQLDGSIELLDTDGKRLYFSEPSGSRLASVYGCALSDDGEKIALITGMDDQRFVFIEDVGGGLRITYHEFLGSGFNRPVRIVFLDNGRYVIFEREGGLGIYNTEQRISEIVRFNGRVTEISGDGSDGLIIVGVTENETQKQLLVINEHAQIIVRAPYKSASTFISRRANKIYIGGDNVLASFLISKM